MQVSIKRRGFDDLIELTVERDEVNIPSLQGAFMIDERTGYIRLRDFSEVTDRELGKELTKLQSRGMQRLLLDLRDNPGGPLDQAIRVSNRFLPRGDMIVYTRPHASLGRGLPRLRAGNGAVAADHRARQPQQRRRLRDRVGRAAGCDRALVVGETTFGKALVQSLYRIAGEAGLAHHRALLRPAAA